MPVASTHQYTELPKAEKAEGAPRHFDLGVRVPGFDFGRNRRLESVPTPIWIFAADTCLPSPAGEGRPLRAGLSYFVPSFGHRVSALTGFHPYRERRSPVQDRVATP